VDAANNPTRQPRAQLSARQETLVLELRKISMDPDLASMFLGACHAIRDQSNPDYLAQAAHSLRELMEKLEGVRGLPVADPAVAEANGTLGVKTRELHDQWKIAQQKSQCFAGRPPANQIDEPLRKLHRQITEFFKWVTNNPKLRSDKPRQLIKGLDPLAGSLPQNIQDAQAKEWEGINQYFQGVAHHNLETAWPQFEATMAALEVFLHSRLAPIKAQHQRDLQNLIGEVEP
jgi:hypothetical protein